MSSSTKLLATIAKIDNNNFTLDMDNMITIDTCNNRIGINTLDPSYSIDILGNQDISGILRCDKIICTDFESDILTSQIDAVITSLTQVGQLNILLQNNNDACFNIIDVSDSIILSKSKNLNLEYFTNLDLSLNKLDVSLNKLDVSLNNLLTTGQYASFTNVEILDLSCETITCNDISTTTFKLVDLYMATRQLYLDLSSQPGLIDNSMNSIYTLFRN